MILARLTNKLSTRTNKLARLYNQKLKSMLSEIKNMYFFIGMKHSFICFQDLKFKNVANHIVIL